MYVSIVQLSVRVLVSRSLLSVTTRRSQQSLPEWSRKTVGTP